MKEGFLELDGFDESLVKLLKQDGRLSFTDIASELNVSVSTVRNRYRKLVDEGIIHILGWVDPTKTGFNSYNRVTIEVSPSILIEPVAKALAKIKEVSFVAVTSGPTDIEINLICRDNRHLHQVMKEKIFTIEGVHNTNSTIYYSVYKWAEQNFEAPLPLKETKN